MGIRALVRYMANGAAVSLVGFVLIGCASQLQLWSDPVGAVVVENDTGKAYRTPVVVNYTPNTKDRDAKGCLLVKGYTATWQSGAMASSPQLIQLCGPGPLWNYKFERPAAAPNLAADLAVQRQLISNRQAGAELLGTFLKGLAQGYAERGNRPVYVPPAIPAAAPTQTTPQNADGLSLPQITPNGTYVSGSKPYSICPNGQYVSGNCTLAPDGTFVGQ